MASDVQVAVELAGAEEMRRAVADLFKDMTGSATKMNEAISAPSTSGLNQYFLTLKEATPAVNEHGRAVGGINSIYRVFNLTLREAGVQVSSFRALSAAAQLGMEGLAAAVALGVVYALGKFADSIEVAKTKLSDLARSQQIGGILFAGIEADAKKLGTSFDSIAPAIQSAIFALQSFEAQNRTFKVVAPPGQDVAAVFTQGYENARKAAEAFIEALRLGGASEKEATARAKAFFDKLQEGGKLTPELVRSLKDVPGAANALGAAFGQSSLNVAQFAKWIGENPQQLDALYRGLVQLKPQLDSAFETQVPDRFQTSLDKVWSSFKNLLRDFANAEPIKTTLHEINLILQGLDWIIQKANNLPQNLPPNSKQVPDSGTGMPPNSKQVPDGGFGIPPNSVFAPESQTKIDDTTAKVQTFDEKWAQMISDINNMNAQPSWTSTLISDLGNAMEAAAQLYLKLLQIIALGPISGGNQNNAAYTGTEAPFASGGYVRGPGSTTSDSILAFLSNREFVQPARAVDYYGVAFMEAIRSLRFPKELFSGGGLARHRGNRFAEGGLATNNLRPFVLNVPGMGSFQGSLSAPDSVIDRLSRRSVYEQLSAGGKPPIWRR